VSRRDELTYDVDQRGHRNGRGPSPRILLLLIVVLVLAALLVVWTLRSTDAPSSAAPSGGMTTPHRSPSPSPSPSATPSYSTSPVAGSDASTAGQAPEGSREAATRFVAAWLEHKPKLRKKKLGRTAVPVLAQQLLLTAPDNIPDAEPDGDPVLEDASTYSAQFRQRLSGDLEVRIVLVLDPEARYGWLATSVEEA
jgi:hypothetical protein